MISKPCHKNLVHALNFQFAFQFALYFSTWVEIVTTQVIFAPQDDANGAVSTSITEMTEIQRKVVRENGDAQFDVSQHRVFLLGENRWEEPSRLVGRDKPLDRRETASPTKCLSCRGEGKLMCTGI